MKITVRQLKQLIKEQIEHELGQPSVAEEPKEIRNSDLVKAMEKIISFDTNERLNASQEDNSIETGYEDLGNTLRDPDDHEIREYEVTDGYSVTYLSRAANVPRKRSVLKAEPGWYLHVSASWATQAWFIGPFSSREEAISAAPELEPADY